MMDDEEFIVFDPDIEFEWGLGPDAEIVFAPDSLRGERLDVLGRFLEELAKATGDGSVKRAAGVKPPWYADADHERGLFSHLAKWKAGENVDPDSGAHPLVHAAWRCLAIACVESGNTPD